ncbi:MAG TPA: hypothetical protein VGQ09_21510 [Chitinophagaceae bacterium]|jgi:hypothetical protein|nr:hypothetical protein [Chitinophagaceae bacterium]
MNQLRFTCLMFCTGMVLFLTSCGGGGNEEKASTDTTGTSTDTTTAATSTIPASTISTTPQNMMVATHKVKDFAKWKASYDEHDSMRLANGIHSFVIGRGLDDSNMVLVAVKVDDMNKAKAFAKDPSLKKAMQKGGVVGAPTFKFVTMIFQDTAQISSDLRSRTTLTVKDWDKWKNSFDSGRQNRVDNGILDRAYGYDVDDNHKVTVVVALTDTAKARAYWKSDALKQRMAQSGVVGQPQRFIYHMVQRY